LARGSQLAARVERERASSARQSAAAAAIQVSAARNPGYFDLNRETNGISNSKNSSSIPNLVCARRGCPKINTNSSLMQKGKIQTRDFFIKCNNLLSDLNHLLELECIHFRNRKLIYVFAIFFLYVKYRKATRLINANELQEQNKYYAYFNVAV
jgi:hypothetical protein